MARVRRAEHPAGTTGMNDTIAESGVFPSRRRPRTAVDTVVQTVRDLLLQRKLKPGDLLPSENEIAASLSVSRGSIREAMKILSAFGVVEIRQGDGTRVATTANPKLFDPLLFNLLVTQPEIEELAELRILVEEGIVRLAVAHADEAGLARLQRAYEDMAESARPEPVDRKHAFAADLAFHEALGSLTGNRLVANVYRFVIELLAPTMHPGQGLDTHLRIVEALRSRDLARALAAVDEHDEIWRRLNVAPGGGPKDSPQDGPGSRAARAEALS
jgi:GntR family transcriptional repressor for pyruvate dehydrogenase complex